MKKEKTIKIAKKSKEIILFLLLAMWCIIPLLKEIKSTYYITIEYEYKFMQLIGIIGIYLLCFNILKKINKKEESKNYIKEIIPIIIFIIYMIWTLISAIFAKDIKKAFYGTNYRIDGYITYIIYAGFFACAYILKSKKIKKALFNLILLVAISNILLIELYLQKNLINILIPNGITTNVFSQFNHYGYYILVVTMTANMLFTTEKSKILRTIYLVAYTFLTYYLIKNNTFGCYLALFITLAIFLIYTIIKKKKIYLSIISIATFVIMSFFVQNAKGENIAKQNILTLFNDIKKIAIAVIPNNEETQITQEQNNKINEETNNNNNKQNETQSNWENAGTGRMKLWKNGIKFIIEKPILGYGPENLEVEYKALNINQDRPHNLLIQLATTSGIPGLLLYILAVGIILKRAIKTMKTENQIQTITFFVVIAYLISAMFGNSMYYTSPYFFIFLGLVMHENEKAKKINT